MMLKMPVPAHHHHRPLVVSQCPLSTDWTTIRQPEELSIGKCNHQAQHVRRMGLVEKQLTHLTFHHHGSHSQFAKGIKKSMVGGRGYGGGGPNNIYTCK
jgi:hypothetical protein